MEAMEFYKHKVGDWGTRREGEIELGPPLISQQKERVVMARQAILGRVVMGEDPQEAKEIRSLTAKMWGFPEELVKLVRQLPALERVDFSSLLELQLLGEEKAVTRLAPQIEKLSYDDFCVRPELCPVVYTLVPKLTKLREVDLYGPNAGGPPGFGPELTDLFRPLPLSCTTFPVYWSGF